MFVVASSSGAAGDIDDAEGAGGDAEDGDGAAVGGVGRVAARRGGLLLSSSGSARASALLSAMQLWRRQALALATQPTAAATAAFLGPLTTGLTAFFASTADVAQPAIINQLMVLMGSLLAGCVVCPLGEGPVQAIATWRGWLGWRAEGREAARLPRQRRNTVPLACDLTVPVAYRRAQVHAAPIAHGRTREQRAAAGPARGTRHEARIAPAGAALLSLVPAPTH